MKRKYWAYLHILGTIALRNYRGVFSDAAIRDAEDSDFVAEVLYPFEADNRAEANEIARRELKPKPIE